MNNEHPAPCCERMKHRSDSERTALIHRLNRIEGQIRGIRGMLEKDAYCPDILTQVSAAQSALASFAKVLLGEHIRTCATEDIRSGKDESVDELIATVQKFMK